MEAMVPAREEQTRLEALVEELEEKVGGNQNTLCGINTDVSCKVWRRYSYNVAVSMHEKRRISSPRP